MLTRFSKGIPTKVALGVGALCLSLSILTERFLPSTRELNFLAGLLLGLSLTMNIWGLIRWRAERVRSGR